MSPTTSSTDRLPTRERRPSTGAPIVDIQGSVGPAGISRPKHKRTHTGFGAGEIKTVEGEHVPLVSDGAWAGQRVRASGSSEYALGIYPAIDLRTHCPSCQTLAQAQLSGSTCLICFSFSEWMLIDHRSFDSRAPARSLDQERAPIFQEHRRLSEGSRPPCRDNPGPQLVQLRRVGRLLGHGLGLP